MAIVWQSLIRKRSMHFWRIVRYFRLCNAILNCYIDQRKMLLRTFVDSVKLFCPEGKHMSEFVRKRLPCTFHHWILGMGESRTAIELDSYGRCLMTLITFIPAPNLRGWSMGQYKNATNEKNVYKLKPQREDS